MQVCALIKTISHTFFRTETVAAVVDSTSAISESVIDRFGDCLLPSSFEKLPYFAQIVEPAIKSCIGSQSIEQQVLLLLSRLNGLRYGNEKSKGWFAYARVKSSCNFPV